MKCPECNREYPSDEVMCDCGYIFEEEDRKASDQNAGSSGEEGNGGDSD